MFLLGMVIFSGAASAQETVYLTLDGQQHALILEPRSVSGYGATPAEGDRFYRAYLPFQPESEGRVAFIDGQWQGMLFHNGRVHLIERLAPSSDSVSADSAATNTVTTMALRAQALSPSTELGQCASAAGNAPITVASLHTHAFSDSQTTSAGLVIDYDTFCDETVADVCLVAELTLVFDSRFQAHFPSSYQSQGIAIAENVDLIYQRNFGVAFKRLLTHFDAGDVFTDDTDSEALLNDVYARRASNQLTAFDQNPRSLFHFVTGRDFDGNIVGRAAVPQYTNYPEPDAPVLCSDAAVGVTQVIGSNSSRATLTSLVMAHEFGHNFGSIHDGELEASGCSATAFLMGSTLLDPDNSNFSSCSMETIIANLNALDPIEACFDFPVDLQILPDTDNTSEAEADTEYTNGYTINALTRSDQAVDAVITGTIHTSAARILAATLDGSDCTLSNSDRTYTCTVPSATTHALSITTHTHLSAVGFTHQVYATTNNRFDVSQGNNQLNETVQVPTPAQTPRSLTSKSDSGGGGGSLGLLGLIAGAWFWRQRRQLRT